MVNKKQIIIKDFFKLRKNSKGEVVKEWFFKVVDPNGQNRIFKKDERVKYIKNFKTQERASKKSLIDYYSKRDNTVYNPTTEKDYELQINKQTNKIKQRKSINKSIKVFKNQNRIIFSNSKSYITNYNAMYVHVTVKVWLDGVWTYSKQRGDLYHKDNYPRGIPNNKIESEIRKATLRAVAPFGSNVKFTIINWQFGFHQRAGFELGETSQYYLRG